MTLLTPSERIRLELIRDKGSAGKDADAAAIAKGWAARKGKALVLTDAGREALLSDAADRFSARSAQRPRRR